MVRRALPLVLLAGLALPAPASAGGWIDTAGGSAAAKEVVAGGVPQTTTTTTTTTRARGLAAVPFAPLIVQYANAHGVEPALVAAVVRAESGFDPSARSRAGARGLMQLMPATARGMGVTDVRALDDPATNIAYGTLYLSALRASLGPSVRRIAAGYNAGPEAVRRHGGVPPYPETRAYVRRVVAYLKAYRGG